MVIARTGFCVSVVSYLVFLLTDLIKPGFVSNYMSVHWFLFTAIIFTIWWSTGTHKRTTVDNRSVIYCVRNWSVASVLGVLAAILVWKAGADLEEFRILSSILAFLLPSIVLGVLRSKA